jgi:hypothetical protein
MLPEISGEGVNWSEQPDDLGTGLDVLIVSHTIWCPRVLENAHRFLAFGP